MLLKKELSHTITLHPSFFGPNMHAQLKDKLYQDVEGTCSGRFGYIITVVSLISISKGRILPGSGLAEFKVKYQAIVFKPYKGEVLDAVVTTVNRVSEELVDKEKAERERKIDAMMCVCVCVCVYP